MKNKNSMFISDSIKTVHYNLLQVSPISSDDDNDIHSHTPPKLSSLNQFIFFNESRSPSIEFLKNDDISHIPEEYSTVIYPTGQLIPLSTSIQQSASNDRRTVSFNDVDAILTTGEIPQSPSTSRTSTRFLLIREELSEAERRKIHNRSCTLRQRRRHYRHEIIRRNIDRRFTITQVKTVLRQLHIPFNAINISRSSITHKCSLYIGIRNPSQLHTYRCQTRYLFTTEHYNEFQSTRHPSRSSSHLYHHLRP